MTNIAAGDPKAEAPQLFIPAGWKGPGQPPLYTAAQVEALSAATADAEDAEDAERYRYLRDCNSGSLVVMQITGLGEDDWHVLTEDDADAAIDAAIAAHGKGGQQHD